MPDEQRDIIAAIAQGQAPDAALVALAGLRSKHNTYLSVPLVFLMVSQHAIKFYSERDISWIVLLAVVVVGWAITKWIFTKSASTSPKTY